MEEDDREVTKLTMELSEEFGLMLLGLAQKKGITREALIMDAFATWNMIHSVRAFGYQVVLVTPEGMASTLPEATSEQGKAIAGDLMNRTLRMKRNPPRGAVH